MQNSLAIEVLKEGYRNEYNNVYELLKDKSRFVSSLKEKEPSEALLKRIAKEEEFIKQMVGFTQMFESLIESYESELQTLRGIIGVKETAKNFFYSELIESNLRINKLEGKILNERYS